MKNVKKKKNSVCLKWRITVHEKWIHQILSRPFEVVGFWIFFL
jgi:hypothetical protein